MRYFLFFLTILLLIHSSIVSAGCYLVYDSKGEIIYRSNKSPVDLSGSVSQAVESKFPGGRLVIQQTPCGSEEILTAKPQPILEESTAYKNTKVVDELVRQNPTYQSDSLSNNSTDYTDSTYGGRSYSGGKTIHTGPRGGRYYYNSSGNKTYVRRK